MDLIKDSFGEALQVLSDFVADSANLDKVGQAGEMLAEMFRAGGKVFSCGNGGSLCDAMHFAEEFTGRFRNDRIALPAIAIADPSHITCIANDYGFEYVFPNTSTLTEKQEMCCWRSALPVTLPISCMPSRRLMGKG